MKSIVARRPKTSTEVVEGVKELAEDPAAAAGASERTLGASFDENTTEGVSYNDTSNGSASNVGVGDTRANPKASWSLLDLLGGDDDLDLPIPDQGPHWGFGGAASPREGKGGGEVDVPSSSSAAAAVEAEAEAAAAIYYDADVLVSCGDLSILLAADSVPVRSLELTATSDLRPLVRCASHPGSASTGSSNCSCSCSSSSSRSSSSSGLQRWANQSRMHCYPPEPRPALSTAASAATITVTTATASAAATAANSGNVGNVSASSSTSSASASASAGSSGAGPAANAERGRLWVEALEDGWRRLSASASASACAQGAGGSLTRLHLVSPRSSSNGSSNGGVLRGGEGAPEFERTLSATFIRGRRLLGGTVTQTDTQAQTQAEGVEVRSGDDNDVRCVLTGVNQPLLLRLQQLGVAPRIVTAPGAVLPGVYSAGAGANGGGSGGGECDSETGAAKASAADAEPKVPVHLQQQRNKRYAQKVAEKQAHAASAVAAYGYTALVVGKREVGLLVHELCQVVYDEAVGSSVNQLQLRTQIARSFTRNRREACPVPIIAAEQPFLHADLAPLYVISVQRQPERWDRTGSGSGSGAVYDNGHVGKGKAPGGWKVTLASLFAPSAAGLLAQEIELQIREQEQDALSVELKLGECNATAAVIPFAAGKHADEELYARVAALRSKASRARQREARAAQEEATRLDATTFTVQIVGEKRQDSPNHHPNPTLEAEDESEESEDGADAAVPLYGPKRQSATERAWRRRTRLRLGLGARARVELSPDAIAGFELKLLRPEGVAAGTALALQLASIVGLQEVSAICPSSDVDALAAPPTPSAVPQYQFGCIERPKAPRTVDTLVWDLSQPDDVQLRTRLCPPCELHPATELARVVAAAAANAAAAARATDGNQQEVTVTGENCASSEPTESVRAVSGGCAYDYSGIDAAKKLAAVGGGGSRNYQYGDRAGQKPVLDSIVVLDGAMRMTV